MLGHEVGLEPVGQPLERRQMVAVGLGCARQGHSDAVERQGAVTPEPFEHGKARTAIHHVIFGMDFEPEVRRRRGERLVEMFGLETDTGGGGHGIRPCPG